MKRLIMIGFSLFFILLNFEAYATPVRLNVYRNKVRVSIKDEAFTDLDVKRYQSYYQILKNNKNTDHRLWMGIFKESSSFDKSFILRALLVVSAKDVGLNNIDTATSQHYLDEFKKTLDINHKNDEKKWNDWLQKKWLTEEALLEIIEQDVLIDRFIDLKLKQKNEIEFNKLIEKLKLSLTPITEH